MSALEFPEFLRRHQLQLLAVSTDDILPGAVVDKERRGYAPQGHLQEILSTQPPSYWDVELNQANLVYGSVERVFSLDGQASLAQMGVRVEGGLSRARSATFAITGVFAKTFVNGPGHASMFSLVPQVQDLRKTDRSRWKLVNGKWIILETFYATEATVSFATSGSVNLKAEVEKAGGVSVSGGGAIRWKGTRSFTIADNNQVPFAFRGWKV